MLEARVTLTYPPPRRPSHHSLRLPTSWAEVEAKDRRKFWQLALDDNPTEMVRHAARLPKSVFYSLTAEDIAQMSMTLRAWLSPRPDCENLPIESFTHEGVLYVFPRPKGENVVCLEFPVADEFYNLALDGDPAAMRMLTATLVREVNPDKAERLRRDDPRVPLHSRDEIRARAMRMLKVPSDVHLAVMYYFAGLKILVDKLYGEWLFEETYPPPVDDLDAPRTAPNFGWWGTYQAVAEAGVFGTVEQVHQTALHDVCVFLVRKEVAQHQSLTPANQSIE